jgi:hypothetical protein
MGENFKIVLINISLIYMSILGIQISKGFDVKMLCGFHTFISMFIIVGSIFLNFSVHNVISVHLVILVCVVGLVRLSAALPVLVWIFVDEASKVSCNVEMTKSNCLRQGCLVPSVEVIRGLFHQRSMLSFYTRKLQAQVFCALVLGLYITGAKLLAQKLRIVRW